MVAQSEEYSPLSGSPAALSMQACSKKSALPWQTIPAMLAHTTERHAGKVAIVDGATRLNYAELQQRLCLAAAEFRALGVGSGDVVAFWAPNTWQWVVGVLACWWSGCVVAPIPARGRILDALPILQATGAKLLVTCSVSVHGNYPELIADYLSEHECAIDEVCPHLKGIVDLGGTGLYSELDLIELAAFADSIVAAPLTKPAEVEASDVCEILFTSGSTGKPKGVFRQHGQVLGNRWSSSSRRGFKSTDVLLAISEFSHTLGLNGTLLRGLMLGATLVLPKNRNPRELAALIHREGVTAISAAPSLFASLLKESVDGRPACKSLRLASIGSARIPPELVRQLLDVGVDSVVSGYGMTECDSIASAGLTETAGIIATTVGQLEEGVEVQITDDEGCAVPAGERGEIWIRGYAVSSGYLTGSGHTTEVAGADGWFRSGDMGCWTEEGYLQILGRKKEVVCVHGYTLYPMEIEALLLQSGMLEDVALLGVPHLVAGEMCIAFIVPRESQHFSLHALRRWARKHIADYKIPGRFILVETLPLGGSGKVDRIALRNMLDE